MVYFRGMSDTHTISPPWERQPGESRQAYSAFCVYRDLPPARRSLDRAWGAYRASLGRPQTRAPGRWESWYRQWQWRARTESRDREEQRLLLEGVVRLKANEVETELQKAQWLRACADELVAREGVTLRTLLVASQVDEASTRQARLALGMPIQITKQEVELKQAVEKAVQAQRMFIGLIRDVLCPSCYARSEATIRRVLALGDEAREKAT